MNGLLDIFFTVFHIVLMVFNLLGWIWKKTRRAHLVTLALTAGSWVLLGIWYGPGYCPLTDWHWDVKRELGETGLPQSFVKYLLDKMFSADIPARLVDRLTLAGLLAAIAGAVIVRIKKKNR